ncbi:MAG: thioredoxin domain-containing protein [Sandaracinaceae bacterium]|nr:thioredoxin domain-containing protein [Sandaracinaceae bacterium]
MEGARPHPALVIIRACALVSLAFSVATAIEYYGGGGTFCSEAGDCARVRAYAMHVHEHGIFLPIAGVVSFTLLFALTLPKGRTFARVAAACALLGAVAAGALVYVQASLGAWCWLCMAIDSSALVAGSAAAWLLAQTPEDPDTLGPGLSTTWWAGFWIAALAPVVYGATLQDPELPAQIRALHREGAVNIVELADFECPYCRLMHPALRAAIEQSGHDVNLVRLTYPLRFHENARPASIAYYCAVAQGQGEPMADRLFEGPLDRETYLAHARALSLHEASFTACLDDPATDARVQEDMALVDRIGMQGLPTVYIGARVQRGFPPGGGPEVFAASIEAVAQGEGRRVRYWPSILLVLLVGASVVWPLRARRSARVAA